MNNIVGVNEYKILTKNDPFAITHSMHECIVMIFKRINSSVFAHINPKGVNCINILNEIINDNNDKTISVEIFLGAITDIEMIKDLIGVLNYHNISYEINRSFDNLYHSEGSIGYDYNTQNYYMYDDGVIRMANKRIIKSM